MRVVFISNYINHHQIPLSNSLYKKLGDNYCFIETQRMEVERIKLGWESQNVPYLLRSYLSDENLQLAHNLVDDADVVVLGGISSLEWLKERKEQKKLTFIYSERIYKQGYWKALSSANRKTVKREYLDYENSNFYLLAASAYLPADIDMYGGYKNKMFKWGYFPEFKEAVSTTSNEKEISLLWVGRFIDWKHPELFVKLVNALAQKGYDTTARMIGTGPLLEKIRGTVKSLNLSNRIELCGPLPVDQVRDHMEASDIFVATSDYQEGWGAVVNEAMNSRCVCVCSHAMGAVPYLISHKKNGLIFKSNDLGSLVENVVQVLDDNRMRNRLSNNAYITIQSLWNANVAADRLLKLARGILRGEIIEYEEGPCSKAPVIKQHKMYKEMVN